MEEIFFTEAQVDQQNQERSQTENFVTAGEKEGRKIEGNIQYETQTSAAGVRIIDDAGVDEKVEGEVVRADDEVVVAEKGEEKADGGDREVNGEECPFGYLIE